VWSRFEGVVGVVYSYAFVGVSNLPFKVSRKASRSLFFVFYYGIVIFFFVKIITVVLTVFGYL
jgi:hypothetical protein